MRANSNVSIRDSYPVLFQDFYEPYVIMSCEHFVPYDERFRGYGLNKCIHLKALASRGCTFHVIPTHFVVAGFHERSVAHSQTYGSESGYRKFVVAAMYDLACKELSQGKIPLMSPRSEQIFLDMRREIQLVETKEKTSADLLMADHGSCLSGSQIFREKLFDALCSVRLASKMQKM